MQYIGIRSEGGLIPYDVLDKIAKEESGLGQQAKDFDLPAGRRLTDEIARAWSDAQDYWHIFQRRAANLAEDETGATLTRKWVGDLLNELLGYSLTYQQAGAVIGGKTYPISHRAGAGEESPPVDIEGVRIDLDKRPEGRRLSPQALVQEYLNNSDRHLWGVVTNGNLFRLLRDTSRTSRPSYLEFDLQSILDGNRFNEFALFYRVCHRTRLPRTAEESTSCWLEKYFQLSIEQGGRVRDKLRDGVEEALKALGTGFLQHPENSTLRAHVKAGTLTPAEFHRQLLRLVYRLLFLMVAEERRMIVPEGPEADRRHSLYDRYYSVGRLRTLAEKPIESSTFGDLWIGLLQTFKLFEDGDSNPLGIPPLNGDLFSAIAVKDLQGTHLRNDVLLAAMQRLSLFEDQRVRQRVNYSALDVEELGSVYESLLDFQPAFSEQPEGISFELRTGSERKSTGSYYTRPELVRELIESALVPVMQDRLLAAKDTDSAKEKEKKQQAILSMSVCDPACGSGHFLLAAARRLGRELAKIKTGEDEPTPKEFHLAVRDVIAHCVYGVDVNPLAVDLCKLALWLEGHWTGKPLSFLDHRIKLGNSLIGVLNVAVLKEGIPDDAFTAVTGDEKKVASAFRRKNRDERKGQPSLPFDAAEHVHHYATESHDFAAITEDTPADVRRKKEAYERARQKPEWWHDWVAANLWTAAFFLPLVNFDDPVVPTHDKFMAYLRGQHVDAQMEGAAIGLATELHFFHWPLEFPVVYERGGFDVILGNPPWEKITLKEEEHWADDAYITDAQNKAERARRIQEYRKSNSREKQQRVARFDRARHYAEAQSKFIRNSERFPLTAFGDVNTYAVFAETAYILISPDGRAGLLTPTGIVSDDSTKQFFGELIGRQQLVNVRGFINEQMLFPSVLHNFKFCALTICGKGKTIAAPDFVFFCYNLDDVRNPDRHFSLQRSDFLLLNPNTLTCPVFRSRADADLNKKVYRLVPVFSSDNDAPSLWNVEFGSMLHMANDSFCFKETSEPDTLPLYEAKMFHQFDHRFASHEGLIGDQTRMHMLPQTTEEQHADPYYAVKPCYYVPRSEVDDRLKDKTKRQWLIATRRISSNALERTVIVAILPFAGASDSITLFFMDDHDSRTTALLIANFNSLVFDYVARQKIAGSNISMFVLKQLPVLPPSTYQSQDHDFILPRVLELTYTSHQVEPFAVDVWKGASKEMRGLFLERIAPSHSPAQSNVEIVGENTLPNPFGWNNSRRVEVRAELDAYYAHLYSLTREEVRYILDPQDVFGEGFPGETFRVLKEREEKELGEYRTRRLVLEAFDKLAKSPRFSNEMPKRESAFKTTEVAAELTH